LTRPIDPEKERAARERAEQKSIEFEKQRAEKDYGWAQYALGVRYLTGKGVEKDAELARQWLEKAAKNGESQAVKKLAELDKQQGEVPETGSASGQPPKTDDSKNAVAAPGTGSASKVGQK
jgi:TPR repeat protein